MNEVDILYGLRYPIIVFLWIIFSIILSYIAEQRGRDKGEFFLLSLLASPLITFLILIALPIKNPDEEQKVKCPHCHGLVDPNVKCCMHCRRDIEWPEIERSTLNHKSEFQVPDPIPHTVKTQLTGILLNCHHCGKMYLYNGVENVTFAACTHCGTHNPVKKPASPKPPSFEAECPVCAKTFPVRQGIGIIETLCPHCQTILKLDTAIS